MPQLLAQLTANLWTAQSKLFHTNSGLFLSDGRALLVDPCIYPDEIDRVKRFVEEREVAVEAIVLTHIHWDHILGPERFPGVRVVAQEEFLRLRTEHESAIKKDIADWEEKANVSREHPFNIPQPGQTFRDSISLTVGSIELELAHAPGHSPDMLVLYHAGSGTLWASDILSDIEIPGVAHSLTAYRRTLNMLFSYDIRVLIPGHGHPSIDRIEIAARLSGDMRYLDELQAGVERAAHDGKMLAEALEDCASIRYHHPEENGYIHRYNVEVAYKELGGEVGVGL